MRSDCKLFNINGEIYHSFGGKVGDYTICFQGRDETNRLYGLIDKHNHIVLPCEYTHLLFSADGVCVTSHLGKVGALNANLEVVIPFKYEGIQRLGKPQGGSLFVVKQNGKCGLLNEQFKFILPEEYEEINGLLFKEKQDIGERNVLTNKVVLRKNKLFGLADSEGRIIIPCEYEYLSAAFGDSDNPIIVLKRYGQSVSYEINSNTMPKEINLTLDWAISMIRVWMIQPRGSNMLIDDNQPVLNDYNLLFVDTLSVYTNYYRKDRLYSYTFKEYMIFIVPFIVLEVIAIWGYVVGDFPLIFIVIGTITYIGIVLMILFGNYKEAKNNINRIRAIKAEREADCKKYFIDLAKWAYDRIWLHYGNIFSMESMEREANNLPREIR